MAEFELNVKINGVEQSVSTIGALEQALADTNAQLSKVEEGSKEFKFLQNQAGNLDRVLKAVTTDAADFSKQIKSVDNSAKQLNTTFNSTVQSVNEIGNSSDDVKKLNDNMKTTASTSASLRQELRQVTLELQNLEPGSAQFQTLSSRAGELRDQIADTNAVINATAGNVTERFGRALTSATQIGVAGFQAMAGAQALFGSENEALNETLVKLTALLNLTQAIETFGGLGDKITEIRAGMGLLSTATATQTVVTEGATVATGALNVAMRALPIFLIIGGLSALGAAIYNYTSRSKEAKREEEDRKKKQDALAKAQTEMAKTVSKESGEFTNLVYQLKLSNAGSEKRIELISKLNSTYGTTLKNLKDEAMFQDQLNASIKEYENLQYNRFKLQKNAEYLDQQREKRLKAESEEAKLLRKFEQDRLKAGQTITRYNEALMTTEQITLKADESLKSYRDRNQFFNADLLAQEKALRAATNATEELQKRRQQLLGIDTKLTDNGKKYGDQQKENNKTTVVSNKLAKDQTALAQYLNDLTREAISLKDQEAKTKTSATRDIVDDIELEKEIALRSLKERYDAAIKTDKEEFKEKRKSKKEDVAITDAYNKEKARLEALYLTKVQQGRDQDKVNNQKLIDDLLFQNETLNSEILFGDENVEDQKDQLRQREYAMEIKALEDKLALNNLDYEDYKKLQDQKLILQGQYAAKELSIQEKVAAAARDRDIANFIKLQESLLNVQITENKKKEGEDESAFQARLALEGEYQVKRLDGTIVGIKQGNEFEKQSYENIIKQKTNLNEKYASDVTQLTNDYVTTNSKTQEDADKKLLEKRLTLLNQYFSEASKALQIFGSSQIGGFASVITASLDGIQEYFKLVDKDFTNTADKISAYATAISGLLNGIISAFQQQNQAQLDAELNALQAQTDKRRDELTTRYNEEVALQKKQYEDGLISEEQYRSAVDSINNIYNNNIREQDNQLAKDKRARQEKAFKQEKGLKIAQTIIAGLQGAVQAFTGALELGFPAGPIVGGILAAAVGTLTGINVNQIKKTELAGTTVPQSTTNLSSSSSSSSAGSALSQAGGGFTSFTSQATGAPSNTLTTTGFGAGSNITKVVVVESDITAAQNRVKVLENNSTFG